MSKTLSLEQIASATKINIWSLRAIESGEFHKLPGGIYNTSYIRQYARAIGFDEEVLLAEYHSIMSLDSPSPVPAPPHRPFHLDGNVVSKLLRFSSVVHGSWS